MIRAYTLIKLLNWNKVPINANNRSSKLTAKILIMLITWKIFVISFAGASRDK